MEPPTARIIPFSLLESVIINHPLKLVNPHIHYNKYVYLSNTNLVNSIRKKGVEVSFTIVYFLNNEIFFKKVLTMISFPSIIVNVARR